VITLTSQTRRLCLALPIFPRKEHAASLSNGFSPWLRISSIAWVLSACFSPQAADWTSLRGGDGRAAAAAAKSGANLNAWDAQGNPALLVAALHGNADAVRGLLEAGVDVNATNRAGATALIYGVSDPAKVKLLLRRGANPNHSSLHGTTPLIAAAGSPNGLSSARQLLAAGANVHATNSFGVDAMWRASYAGNAAIVRLLLNHGADPNTRPIFPTIEGNPAPAAAPLHNAAFRGETEMIKALLNAGADLNAMEPFAGNALHNALYANHPKAAALLVKTGVNLETLGVHGEVPAMVWTGYSDVGDTTAARLLLERHVPVTAENELGETALTWARKRGTNALVSFLSSRGVPEGVRRKEKTIPANDIPQPGTPAWRTNLRGAIQKSVDALEVSSSAFLDSNLAKRDNCVTCHQQTIPAVAFGQAQRQGFNLDAAVLKKQLDAQLSSWVASSTNAYELDEPQADAPVNLGWGLYGLAALGHKPDALTDAEVCYLAAVQEKDGSWRCDDFRPPIEDGAIGATALALHALQLYPIPGREREMEARIQNAADWLSKVEARTPNRLAFKLLGLGWSGSHQATQKLLAEKILNAQRPDGGWAQLPGLESDAWATAQALTALRQAKAISANDPAYGRGAAFLLRTQFADGSWFVRSRTWPFQPYFNSQFPHGKDQWISAAGTAWATLVLLETLEAAAPQKAVAFMTPGR
jgi:ankyrin repeat protein